MKLGIVITLILTSSLLFAQPGAGDPNGGGKPGSNPVPLGGVEILIAAGALLGAKKVFNKKINN